MEPLCVLAVNLSRFLGIQIRLRCANAADSTLAGLLGVAFAATPTISTTNGNITIVAYDVLVILRNTTTPESIATRSELLSLVTTLSTGLQVRTFCLCALLRPCDRTPSSAEAGRPSKCSRMWWWWWWWCCGGSGCGGGDG
jgi:hypothetical protein